MKSTFFEDAAATTAAVLIGSTNPYACNVEELEIRCDRELGTMTKVLESIGENMSFPALRKLSVDFIEGISNDDSWIRLTDIFYVAPLLKELHIEGFHFWDETAFKTLATNINNAPCSRLHWSLSKCCLTDHMAAVLAGIACQDNAKLSRLCIGPPYWYNDNVIMRNVMKSQSLTELEYWSWTGMKKDRSSDDLGLNEILQALEGRLGQLKCQVTTFELFLSPWHRQLYLELIQSIPRWTSLVKSFRLGCPEQVEHLQLIDFFPDDDMHSKFLHAVRENFHLRAIDLEINTEYGNDNLEESRTLLLLYCERNRKFWDVVNKPYTLPVYLWPYILYFAGRAGPDSAYQFLRQSGM